MNTDKRQGRRSLGVACNPVTNVEHKVGVGQFGYAGSPSVPICVQLRFPLNKYA